MDQMNSIMLILVFPLSIFRRVHALPIFPLLKIRVAMLPGKPGEPGKVNEFKNWQKIKQKSGNLKIDQKIKKFYKIDWLAIASIYTIYLSDT